MQKLCILLCVLTIIITNFYLSESKIEKRDIDPEFLRRYNHLKKVFRNNPLAFDYLKYFLRNRGQRRERRQVDFSFDNGNQLKKNTTRRIKPFRPPMLFF